MLTIIKLNRNLGGTASPSGRFGVRSRSRPSDQARARHKIDVGAWHGSDEIMITGLNPIKVKEGEMGSAVASKTFPYNYY
jgi:hypothetical protein